MASGWKHDKRWSDRFIPEIRMLIANYLAPSLIGESTIEEDQKRNTDLLVLKMDTVRIACRIRRHKYFSMGECRKEFTIRTVRPTGSETELSKVVRGWGDYIFYGFSDEKEEKLIQWFIGDLSLFRLWFNWELSKLPRGIVPGEEKQNRDESSEFRVFKLDSMPEEFIVVKHIMSDERYGAIASTYQKQEANYE